MHFAINYSLPTAGLLRARRIEVDYLKCPAWPDLITAAQGVRPIYVHFPLRVGMGIGDALDTESGRPADWKKIEALLVQTGTPLVNVHLTPTAEDYAQIPADSCAPAHIEQVTEGLIRDIRAVAARFGPDRVIVENGMGDWGDHQRLGLLPQVIGRVLRETGCGLLLDVSHARLAAPILGMDVRDYIAALPIARTREIHITGIQRVEGRWLDALRERGVDPGFLRRWTGQLTDHLPMTEADWEFAAWAAGQVHSGAWGQPWIVTCEYGGVGPLWEALTDPTALAEQTPRLYALFREEG